MTLWSTSVRRSQGESHLLIRRGDHGDMPWLHTIRHDSSLVSLAVPWRLTVLLSRSSLPLPACVVFNLDEEESEGGIAVNLLPLLARELQHRTEPWSNSTSKRSEFTWWLLTQ